MSKIKQYEVLKRASLFLAKHEREERVAQILLQHHLGLSRTAFYMNMQEEIPGAVQQKFEADIKQHAKMGIPIQHMMGYEEFYGRTFSVDNHVLIPRPETEELVEEVIKQVKKSDKNSLQIVDAGTGSGVIAITLALELDKAVVLATDISVDALKVAEKNAFALGAEVDFLEGNFLEPLIKQGLRVDVIVSNPPYISENEKADLSDTVKNFDPALALFAAADGLAAYKTIIEQSKYILNPGGFIAFEIGHTQAQKVKQIIKETYPQADVDIFQDINKKNRIITAQLT